MYICEIVSVKMLKQVVATTNEHIPEDLGMKVHDQLQAFLNTSAELKVWFGNL